MLIWKVTVVPLFMAAVSFAGRHYGAGIAGLLAGFPVVAGPIVIFLAVEHGIQFGARAATAAMPVVAGLLSFGAAYCWASLRWRWPVAMTCRLSA